MSDRRPYDRLPGETAKAYHAFSLYRDLGSSRTIDAVAQELNKSRQLIGRWSGQHSWVQRAQSWDLEQDYQRQEEAIALRRKEYKDQIAEFHKNHLAVGRAAFKVSATTIKQILDFAEGKQKIETLDDANKAANVVKALMPIADLWAKALAVDRLLDRLENDDG